MRSLANLLIIVALLVSSTACRRQQRSEFGFIIVSADHHVSPSAYPLALDPQRVGTYPTDTKSGAGYFYDDVLEYRVWMCPRKGATPLNGSNDYMAAFAQYEAAEAFSKRTRGAEEPEVLVRQREWIDEPEPGKYVPKKGERITEWQVAWLKDDKRTPDSISEFLKHPRPAKAVPGEADDEE